MENFIYVKNNSPFSILILTILLAGCSSSNQNITFKEDVEHAYSNNYTYKFIGESDSFFETTEDNFKESIQLETKYCIVDHCETEILQLKYMDE